MYFHLRTLYVWVFQRNNSLFCEWEPAMNINISENLMQSTVAFLWITKQLSRQRMSLDKISSPRYKSCQTIIIWLEEYGNRNGIVIPY